MRTLLRLSAAALLVAGLTTACSADVADGDEQSEAVSVAARRFEPRAEESGAFSVVNAAWLARASDVVYESHATHSSLKEVLASELKRLGGPDFQVTSYRFFEAQNDTQAVYLATDRIAILAFRGTENKTDIRTDLQFRKVPLGEGKVHRGFYGAFSGLWDGSTLLGSDRQGLSAYLAQEEAKRPGVPLYVTGHSLGAALSTLAVHAALGEGRKVYAHYTFGSPRVGNEAFAHELAARAKNARTKLFRVVNFGDPVTVSPPSWLGYEHVDAPGEKEDEGNARFVFLSKTTGVHWVGTHKREHDFLHRVSAYWASLQSKAPLHHPSRFYVCKLDKVLDPGAKCLEVLQNDAHPACVAMANAVAQVAARPVAEGGCGESYDESVRGYLEAAGCGNVKRAVDEGKLRRECLPAIEALTCDALRSGNLGSEACRDPFVYE